jgi:hypothetical protein
MFADDEIEVDARYELAVARLTQLVDPHVWHAMSESVYEHGLETLLRVGPFGGSRGLSKLVRVQALPPVTQDGGTHVALRWVATGHCGDLFPALDADLGLTPVGGQRSRLRLVGSYRPPLGRAGAVLDRAVMHHIATATIRALLRQVAYLITSGSPATATSRERE